MIFFFKENTNADTIFAVDAKQKLQASDIEKLRWMFSDAQNVNDEEIDGCYIGPRKEMVTPWSTNAVEISQNMGISGIARIEQFMACCSEAEYNFDPMLQERYQGLNQYIFTIDRQPEPIVYIDDIAAYNQQEGLALSPEEIDYLNNVSTRLGRKLTDSEVFGFSQVNSEHCRHKIFNGTFVIDSQEQTESLFQLIKKTSKENPNRIVSAYSDNVAFVKGPKIQQFAPETQYQADYFTLVPIDSILSLKAETHNFPTTVEPFNGAATGSGGEIRDRMAGGKGSIPLAGTAVYMTAYPRSNKQNLRIWEQTQNPRKWLYHSPEDILIKASNGASDFGNKFGQPLICGSLLTFEHASTKKSFGYDKVIMLAGGIGYAKASDSNKSIPKKGDKIIVLGGDNYRIGMGGGAVSSVATGEYDSALELNAVQRSNPEMQKRVYNALRALAEAGKNPVISVHDHGAGGHLNSLSELVEATGGIIYLRKLPVGDPTLSAKEIIGNESQERMGLLIKSDDLELVQKIAERERAPFYVVGEVTDDMTFVFEDEDGTRPIDMKLDYLFGKPPKTMMRDISIKQGFPSVRGNSNPLHIKEYMQHVLQLEAVACKDWLTNKVDRSVTGKVAMQQTAGAVQLPVNNLGIAALDYDGNSGVATAIGHAPVSGLIDSAKSAILSIAEALTNIVWAPVTDGIRGISLSANWMWPCKNKGEDSRLYKAVQAASDFAIALKINIPTGKDSLSMTQKYPDGSVVYAPGTVIISAAGEVNNIRKAVTPVLAPDEDTRLLYIDFSKDYPHLGGSSYAQTLNCIGSECPTVQDAGYFAKAFDAIQQLITREKILAGHDVSAGGLLTTLHEMTFTSNNTGLTIDFTCFDKNYKLSELGFSERPGVVIQVKDMQYVTDFLHEAGIGYHEIGKPVVNSNTIELKYTGTISFPIGTNRNKWFESSYLLDRKQCGVNLAKKRFANFAKQELHFAFPQHFTGKEIEFSGKNRPKAAIIREKGVNGDREMAYSMYYAGFDVKDIHTTDLISGRENLEDVQFIVFVGGFSNSDVLGSGKGWAGALLYNEKARIALENFYKRNDTLSLGVCNGCQLMTELDLLYPLHSQKPRMQYNDSHKFESAFLNVSIARSNSVMLQSLAGTRLGIWVAHGEGKFCLPYEETRYNIPMKYSYGDYPGNPNGSDFSAAGICSPDGRHLAMMPHIERAIFPWQWAHYPANRTNDEVTPWIEAFVNACNYFK